ncbi:MAG: hypothetical protein IJK27_03720 [Bacilli bacterium]|nr:hypothetical protein [Bacilli bacterium]
MKKKIIILATSILLPLSLAACSNKKSSEVKFEEFKFSGDPVTEIEKAKLLDGVFNKLSDLKEMKGTGYRLSSPSENRKSETSIEIDGKAYEGFYLETKNKETTKVEEPSYKYSFVEEENSYIYLDEEKKVVGTVSEQYEELPFSYFMQISETELPTLKEQFYKRMLWQNVVQPFGIAQLEFYKEGKNSYITVSSDITETHTAVVRGDETFDKLEVEKSQSVFSFNSKFEITRMTRFSETTSNYDDSLNVPFAKERVIEKETSTLELKYGKKAANEAAINTFKTKYANPFVIELESSSTVGDYNSESGTYTPSSELPTLNDSKFTIKDDGSVHFEGTLNFENISGNNAFAPKFSVKFSKGYAAGGEEVVIEKGLSLGDNMAKMSFEAKEVEGNQVYVASSSLNASLMGEKLYVSFDMKYANESVEFSNVSSVRVY